MTNKLTITILGCGASGGVPVIGNFWGKCHPDEPRNARTRSSIAVQSEYQTLIVDTGPEFRSQLNRENIQDVQAVFYTHAHGDHIAGMDELQSFRRRYKRRMPVYGQSQTIEELESRYFYLFKSVNEKLYPPAVEANIFTPENLCCNQEVAGIKFIPFQQDHGTCTTLGFRFGDVSYSTDMLSLSEEAQDIIKGSRVWIVDGCGIYDSSNPVHASIPQVIEMNKYIGAKSIYFTHLSLMMDYRTIEQDLPEGFHLCYDGLKFNTKNQEPK